MKKCFVIAASMIAAVSVLSCTTVFPKDEDPEIPVTGDEEPEAPSEGDGDLVFDCPEAYGFFYGQYVDNDGNLVPYDSYAVEFDTEGISWDESTGFTGTGYVAYLDIDTGHTTSLAIPAGTYSSDSDPNGDFYAYPGESGVDEDGQEYLSPAYIVKFTNSEPEYIVAEKVKLTVSSTNSAYMLKAELEDGDGNVFVFNYSGVLPIADLSGSEEDPGTGDPGDGELVNLPVAGYKYGYAVYFGQAWNVSTTDYSDWILYVSDSAFDYDDDDFWAYGDYAMIEILTAKSATTSVPAGTYTCMTTGSESEFVPGKLIFGMTDEESGYPTYGTWFFQGEDWAGATDGSITVKSVKGNAYTIDVDLVDADYGYSMTGSFTAELEYIDGTKAAAQARQTVKKAQARKKSVGIHPTKTVRKNKFRPRFAK